MPNLVLRMMAARPLRAGAALMVAACSGAVAAPNPDTLPERMELAADDGAVDLQCRIASPGSRRVALERSFVDTFDRYPDMGRWQPHYDGRYEWPVKRWLAGNKEQQIYVDRRYPGSGRTSLGIDPFRVADGKLAIVADRAPEHALPFLYGQRYTSGLLSTRRSFTQQYGYFEFRAKMPAGQGLWPAFWLLPENVRRPFPEIDILEVKGREPQRINMTVHYGEAGTDQHRATNCARDVPTSTTAFHNYGALVEPERITYYIDRVPVATLAAPPTNDQRYYMLVNLALGGPYGGDVDATTRLPATLMVDHVVAYRLVPQGRPPAR